MTQIQTFQITFSTKMENQDCPVKKLISYVKNIEKWKGFGMLHCAVFHCAVLAFYSQQRPFCGIWRSKNGLRMLSMAKRLGSMSLNSPIVSQNYQTNSDFTFTSLVLETLTLGSQLSFESEITLSIKKNILVFSIDKLKQKDYSF